MAKFSIVIPIYNVEQFLPKCIESLINQTLQDIEIILIDDGSPDRCGEICDKYASQDNRIKVIHKKNGGVSAARNNGIDIATGKYIIFCDSDDWMPKDACEKLYNEGIRTNADIVIGNIYKIENGKSEIAKFYANEFVTEDRTFITKLIQADFHRNYCPLPDNSGPAFGYGGPWNKAVRLEMIRKNNIKFDLRAKGIFDDIIYTAYILATAKKISYIKTPVYYYRIVPTSITRTYKPNILEINNGIFEAWKDFLNKHEINDCYKKALYANVIRRLDESLKLYFVNPNNKSSLIQKISLLKRIMKEEPYKTAIKKVETPLLHKRQKMVVSLLRLKAVHLTWIIYYIYLHK